jgi:hypothetical protein
MIRLGADDAILASYSHLTDGVDQGDAALAVASFDANGALDGLEESLPQLPGYFTSVRSTAILPDGRLAVIGNITEAKYPSHSGDVTPTEWSDRIFAFQDTFKIFAMILGQPMTQSDAALPAPNTAHGQTFSTQHVAHDSVLSEPARGLPTDQPADFDLLASV